MELKEIALYYAHKLKCQLFNTKHDGSLEYERDGELVAIQKQTENHNPLTFRYRISENSKWTTELCYLYSEVKPIMHPLSDLVKPCLEGGNIPIVQLAKIAQFNINFTGGEWICTGTLPIAKNGDLKFLLCQTLFYGTIEGDHKNHNNQIYNQIDLFNWLYEYHFWLGDQLRFGKDIIDINTLNK